MVTLIILRKRVSESSSYMTYNGDFFFPSAGSGNNIPTQNNIMADRELVRSRKQDHKELTIGMQRKCKKVGRGLRLVGDFLELRYSHPSVFGARQNPNRILFGRTLIRIAKDILVLCVMDIFAGFR